MADNSGYPKLHHYLPASYLARFADGREQIRAYARGTTPPFLVSIHKIAAETHFYRLDHGTPEERLIAETTLGQAENAAKIAIDDIVGGGFPPSADDRIYVALFIGLQLTRTREARHATAHQYNTTVNQLVLDGPRRTSSRSCGLLF
jgi:Protein of unknown function (DUF4238)